MRPELTADEFRKFQEFIYKSSGIRTSDTKLTLLSNRIRRRLEARKLATFQAYFQFLTSPAGKEELEAFLDAITTNETFFFRTEKHFEWFETEFISEMIRRPRPASQKQSLRVWSAAASTGQEAYSLGMLLLEEGLGHWNIQIVGTDFSSQVVERARQATYRQVEVNRGLPANQLVKYFRRTGANWQLNEDVRRMAAFDTIDLRASLRSRGPFDLVFCRNVMIYFDAETKRRIVKEIHGTLFRGGWLLVGGAETVFGAEEWFEKQTVGQTTIYVAR